MRGFIPHSLKRQPEGAPAKGDRFEFSYPPTLNSYVETIWTYEVIGWERHVFNNGNEEVSVRVKPIEYRTRRVSGLKRYDMGHWHEVFEGEPCLNNAPYIWGFGAKRDDEPEEALQ